MLTPEASSSLGSPTRWNVVPIRFYMHGSIHSCDIQISKFPRSTSWQAVCDTVVVRRSRVRRFDLPCIPIYNTYYIYSGVCIYTRYNISLHRETSSVDIHPQLDAHPGVRDGDFLFYFFPSLLLSSSTRRRFYPQRPSGQAVVTDVVPSSPPVRAFNFYRV